MSQNPGDFFAKPFAFATQLLIECDGRELLGPAQFELLRQLAIGGSITAAAQALNISYRTAWTMIENLNNLAGTALVERTKGGSGGGGGAHLTATGERLMAAYKDYQQRQQQYLAFMTEQQFNAAGVADQSQDAQHYLTMLRRLTLQTSARNQLAAEVVGSRKSGPQVVLQLQLGNGQRIRSRLSQQSVDQLGLQKGSTVIAIFKASAVVVVPSDAVLPIDFNRLEGLIDSVEEEAGRTQIALDISGGLSVHGLHETAPEQSDWQLGQAAMAVFDPSVVLIATDR